METVTLKTSQPPKFAFFGAQSSFDVDGFLLRRPSEVLVLYCIYSLKQPNNPITMAPRKQTAKNSFNQAALDRLSAKYTQTMNNGSERYGQTLKRAMNSLASQKEPITTYQQAMDLKFVGTHCANIICPPNASNGHRLGSGSSPSSSADESRHSNNRTSSKRANNNSSTTNNNTKKRKAKSTYDPPKKQALYEAAKLRANEWKQHQKRRGRINSQKKRK